jgi:hypothetical protein
MGKATVQNLLDEGVRPEQFGFASASGPEWSGNDGYLARALAPAAGWARERLGGAVYDALAAGTYAHDCTVRAEVCHARALLFTRRVSFLDSQATVGLGAADSAYLNRREMLAHAEEARRCAQYEIAEAIRATGGDVAATMEGGASFGYIETGAFPAATTGALNG